MVEFVMRGRTSRLEPVRRYGMTTSELRQAVRECYCGLGPACEIWRKMTPDERAACTRDKRAYAQLLWMQGEAG
jgi:hypothetical protein